MVQAKIDASINTAIKWFAYYKAFKKMMKRNLMALVNTVTDIDHQVKATGTFSMDVIQQTFQCTAKVYKRDVKNSSLTDRNLAITSSIQCSRPGPCRDRKLQTKKAKVCREKSTGVTVTGASPYRASVLLKNKFQPLQMLMVDDHMD